MLKLKLPEDKTKKEIAEEHDLKLYDLSKMLKYGVSCKQCYKYNLSKYIDWNNSTGAERYIIVSYEQSVRRI